MSANATFVRRPARAGSGLALAAGLLAVATVADASVQRWVLGLAAVGFATCAASAAAWRRDLSVLGAIAALGGTAIVLAAVALAATRPSSYVHRLELLPGVVGLVALAAGLFPVRVGWERPLVTAGTGLVFVAVLAAGVLRDATLTSLLAAGALTILAWDSAENAVSLGRQVGADAATVRATLARGAVGGVVAGGAILLTLGVVRLDVDGLPFAALAALLVAGVALALVHHR